MSKYNGLIISLIAGLSTLFGYFSIYIKGDKNKIISYSLSFSGGVMLSLSIISLFPTGLENLNSKFFLSILIFIIGYFICMIINNLFKENDKLYKTGIISMIGIILHNIPEGIVTYILSAYNIKLGLLFSIAIIMHNIPEGIGIAIPLYNSKNNKLKTFLYTFVSGLSEPLGALLSIVFLYKYISRYLIGVLFLLIGGIMTYISCNLLIKTAKEYNSNNLKYTLYGMLFITIVEILLKM